MTRLNAWMLTVVFTVGCGGSAGDPLGDERPSGDGQPGDVTHTTVSIPFGLESSCEHDGAERVLTARNRSVVPERMYTAGCTGADGSRRLFVSVPVTTGHDRTHPQLAEGHHSQVIFEAELDASTGAFALTGNAIHQPECLDAHGIAVSSDCSTVATLCRRPHFTSETQPFTRDLVAEYGNDDIDQPGPIGGEPSDSHADYNDEMWLYEWNSQELSETPDKYVVHKGIGPLTRARGLGNYYLLFGEDDDSYAVAVRSSTGGGTRHVADAFLVIDRSGSDYAIASGRGYTWACGRGHTTSNIPAYNPSTGQYAIWCMTDFNADKIGGINGMWFRTESMGDSDDNQFIAVNAGGGHRQGSVQSIRPLPNGNYLGALVAHPEARDDWGMDAPTKVALARFDGNSGSLIDGVNWVVSDSNIYLGHAQLGVLGEDRYLLGYAELFDRTKAEEDEGRNSTRFMIPSAYHVVEIDGNGNALTSSQVMADGAGWGDQDQWTNLGAGFLAWAYIPDAVFGENGETPGCSSDTLRLSLYRAAE